MDEAADQLAELWDVVKSEENCTSYVQEMCVQLKMLGTESNTLTRQMIAKQLEQTLFAVQSTLKN